jgi:hypothetical protein
VNNSGGFVQQSNPNLNNIYPQHSNNYGGFSNVNYNIGNQGSSASLNMNVNGYPSFGNNSLPVNSVNNGMSMSGNVKNVKKDPLDDLFG